MTTESIVMRASSRHRALGQAASIEKGTLILLSSVARRCIIRA